MQSALLGIEALNRGLVLGNKNEFKKPSHLAPADCPLSNIIESEHESDIFLFARYFCFCFGA